jgi:nucleotide-binding universal stress UspA family protein
VFKRILVPLDGSPLAERALPYAGAVAGASGARLVLLRAAQAHTFPGVDPREAQVAVVREAEEYLAAVAGGMAAPEAVEQAVFYGPAVEAIGTEIRLRAADLVAMSTHGRSGLGRWIYGSVAEQVLRQSEVPVLLVPAACDRDWSDVPPKRPRRVIVPLDGSALAEEALAPAQDLARALGAGLFLLRAVEPPHQAYAQGYSYVAFNPEGELGEAARYLGAVAGQLRAAGFTAETGSLVASAASTIVEVARKRNALAIAMATHGQGGLARLLLGGVATGVLHRTHVPLLVVRPAAVRLAEAGREREDLQPVPVARP